MQNKAIELSENAQTHNIETVFSVVTQQQTSTFYSGSLSNKNTQQWTGALRSLKSRGNRHIKLNPTRAGERRQCLQQPAVQQYCIIL